MSPRLDWGKLKAGALGRSELLPGGITLAVILVLITKEGGFEPTSWYPAALFLLGLLAVTVAAQARSGRLRLDTSQRVAVILFAAFVAWSFLSITWSDVKGDAWDGANRTLLYFLVFALFASLRWSGPSGA